MQIDDLTYIYDQEQQNQLLKVIDNTLSPQGFKDSSTNDYEDYRYDENGNMVVDRNKEIIDIKYNHLNLPIVIQFNRGDKIEYIYNAVGQKLSKKVTQGSTITTTDYMDGFQYTNNILSFFPHPEGYVYALGDTTRYKFFYVYNYTDHLGNIRLSYGKDPQDGILKIIEENHYYPFGLKHTNYNSGKKKYEKQMPPQPAPEEAAMATATPISQEEIYKIRPVSPFERVDYQYKYNGKELQDELGLNVYAYGWRDYDPAIGRFTKIDRFAEKYPKYTPYGYAGNNPVLINDIQGDSLWISFGKNEKALYENGKLLSQGKDGKFSQYKGNQAKLDKNGNVKGYKGFLGKAVNALNTASSKSAGGDLISEIQSSTENISIVESSNGNSYYPSTNTVSFDPSSGQGGLDSTGGTSRPSFIGLGHELAHGLDDIRGTLNTTKIPGYNFTEAEKFATHIENQMRSEHNVPLRTHYSYSVNPSTNAKTGVYPLLNGRMQSLHYPNFYYGGVNSNLTPVGPVQSSAQILPSITIIK